MLTLENVTLIISAYALALSLFQVVVWTKKLPRLWQTRHLRRVWGLRNKDYVIVVCSELDDPESRQNVEQREFIYSLKYGDVDAYFEVIITLLRLFPNIRLKVLSAGEAIATRIDMSTHLVLIGGPDYNGATAKILERCVTRYFYKSPYVRQQSTTNPEEIVICDRVLNCEYCEHTNERDYGYFERIQNPHNPEKRVILIGGCHTIGVTGAAKAFSMVESEQGEIPKTVLKNAKLVAGKISADVPFAILVSAERFGQTINTPLVNEENIRVDEG